MLTLRIVGIEIVETWNSEKSGFVNANNANTTVMSKRTVQTSPQNDWIILYPSRWFTIERDGIIVERRDHCRILSLDMDPNCELASKIHQEWIVCNVG